jgi:hypothetical protein
MAGGSLPNIPIKSQEESSKLQQVFLKDVCQMSPIEGTGCIATGSANTGYLVYPQGDISTISVSPGKYQLYTVDMKNGTIRLQQKSVRLQGSFTPKTTSSGQLIWLRAL